MQNHSKASNNTTLNYQLIKTSALLLSMAL